MGTRLQDERQMSDSFLCAAILTFSGGLQDAYTYWGRGHVFANAQTGNIVFLGSYMFQGQWASMLWYIIPIISFILGIFITENFRRIFRDMSVLHWRQVLLAVEIGMLFVVGFLSQDLNILANCIISFICAMQFQAFNKVRGNAYASTMCTGNLRSGVVAFCTYMHKKDRKFLVRSGRYFLVILIFIAGAGLGYTVTGVLAEKTIWLSCAILAVAFALMFVKGDNKANN